MYGLTPTGAVSKKRLIELIRTICDFKIKPPLKSEGISLTI